MLGKTVLITGASKGIGRACALEFSKRGANLVLTSRSAAGLDETAKLTQNNQSQILSLPGDITDRSHVKSLFSKTKERFEYLDILVNNAGSGLSGTVADLDIDKLEYILKLNFYAPLLCIQEALKLMTPRNQGQIINISSIAGKRGVPFFGGYCASKFALNGLTEALRVELNSSPIKVLLVCPGGTATDFYQNCVRSTSQDYKSEPKSLMTPEQVAQKIIEASIKGKHEVVIGQKGKLLVNLNRLSTYIADRFLSKVFNT